MDRDFDIVVIGGGHAGAEAAHAAARMGMRTALVTLSARTIAAMSCNPAIGGIGKGQIVREVDALGGLMGLAADATGIQFRMLNRSKGPAVWGPRCQSDRHEYARWVQAALAATPGLTILDGEATEIVAEGGRVVGVSVRAMPGSSPKPIAHFPLPIAHCQEAEPCPDAAQEGFPNRQLAMGNRQLSCRAVVVTAGTFLGGLMHLGEKTFPGGRYGEPAAGELSGSLRELGLTVERLKTGTCARVAAESIDYSRCVRQDGDAEPLPFSFLTGRLAVEQVPCWLTETNEEIHRVVRENLCRAPLHTGQIQSVGPRYCPSFETKVVRFADKTSHQVFLEPEGRGTNWVYCNGLSTSMPPDVQDFLVRHCPGLERAEILRYGYAIEYDYCPPTQLAATLETKAVGGLYLAGQIDGTTGYEEAAGLGLVAGVNAALAITGREAMVLRRDQAYIGVMIDDLVTKGISEPYRMFTSRAEHRLHLRADNADRRLTEVGRQIGLVDDARWSRYGAKRQAATEAAKLLQGTSIVGKPFWELLQRPDMTLARLLSFDATGPVTIHYSVHGSLTPREDLARLVADHPQAMESVVTDARYAGYLSREAGALRQLAEMESKLVPEGLDYAAVPHLRHEAKEKLSRIRPRSLGQALRVSGVTPADVTVLAIHLAGRKGKA